MTTATTVNVQFQLRADTAANWTAANPILLVNEFALETDTKKLKFGDGTTAWASLAYFPSIVTGGTVLGNLEIGSTGTLTFEGSTANDYETTLAVTDPTADRTITLPDQSGTVVVSGNASIVDADIAADAEIAVSKLANGTANQVLVTDGTDVSWSDDLTIAGNLTVNGTTTTVNTETLVVEDKNIELGVVDTPTDVTADGGGITLRGSTDKTINWIDATDSWTSSENIDLANGKSYRINDTEVLSATTLGSGVTSSSLTSVGTLGSVTVTGDATAGTFIPTGGTAPSNGLYLPATNSVALSTNGTGRLFVDASGNVGFNATPEASTGRTVLTSNGTSGNEIRLNTNGTQSLALITASGIGIIRAPEATGYLRFDTGGTTERLRITSTGQLSHIGAGSSGSPAVSFSGSAASNSLVVDSSSRVGIGTSLPGYQLTQSQANTVPYTSSSASSALPDGVFHYLVNTDTTADDTGCFTAWLARGTSSVTSNWYAGNTGGDATARSGAFVVGNRNGNTAYTERLRITSAGHVGIGTTGPTDALQVANGNILIGTGGSSAGYRALYFGSSTTASARFSYIEKNNDSPYDFNIVAQSGTTAASAINFKTTPTATAATIDSSGRLLVGTSSNTSGGLLQIRTSSTSNRNVSFRSDQASIGYPFIQYFDRSANNAAVSSGETLGTILFRGHDGTTLISSARITAEVDGTPGADDMPGRLVFSVTPDGGSSPTTSPSAMTINSGQEVLIGYSTDNGAYKLQVNSQIFATSATIATSDGRYKENVATLDGCVDLVKALRPVSFDWKAQEPVTRVDEDGETVVVREAHNFPDGKQVGFIAQEVEEVLADKPWLGSVIKQNVRPAVTDADGNELAPEEEFLGIAEGNLVAVLTSALKDAITKIETLEQRLNDAGIN